MKESSARAAEALGISIAITPRSNRRSTSERGIFASSSIWRTSGRTCAWANCGRSPGKYARRRRAPSAAGFFGDLLRHGSGSCPPPPRLRRVRRSAPREGGSETLNVIIRTKTASFGEVRPKASQTAGASTHMGIRENPDSFSLRRFAILAIFGARASTPLAIEVASGFVLAAEARASRRRLAPTDRATAAQQPPAQQPPQDKHLSDATAANPDRDQFRPRRLIVSDNKGAILDLKQEDFSVTEDGKPQRIESFSIVKIDNTAQVEDRPPSHPERLRRGTRASRPDVRLFVILLDDYHVRRGNAMRAQAAPGFIQNQLALRHGGADVSAHPSRTSVSHAISRL